jgi:hypothetical protein
MHHTNVYLYIEQGTLPNKSLQDDYRSIGANTSLNTPLVIWNAALRQYDPAAWPWNAGHSFYLVVSNSTAVAQDFTFIMNGCNDLTEDEDRDELADIWERFFFGNITSQVQTNDTDRDGVRNLEEQHDGTDPTNPADYYCRLTVAPIHGSVLLNPAQERYQIGQEVVLTPVPDQGFAFVGWSGDASGNANPLRLVMDRARNLTALFKLAGDDFATPLWLNGDRVSLNAMNVSMTKEPGEPYHAGNPGGKSIWWRWIAPRSATVNLDTFGSSFSTLLAVYTGADVADLTRIASDFDSGTNCSRLSFNALAGTTYNIVVDGYDGASSYLQLALAMSGSGEPIPDLRCGIPQIITGGNLRVALTGPTNRACVVEVSTNLVQWQVLQSVTTGANGTASVTTPAAGPIRFYRARLQ